MKQMNNILLFDFVATQPNESGKRHGGGKYGEIVFRRMVEMGYSPVCYYTSNKWFNPEMSDLIKKYNLRLYDISSISLEEIIKKENIDILYSCLPSGREQQCTACKVIGTMHGPRYIETPYDNTFWWYRNNTLKYSIRWCLEKYLPYIGINWKKDDKFYRTLNDNPNFEFITVSNHSALALKSYYSNYKDTDIPVFYSPSTSSLTPIEKTKYHEKYFLMVSGNRWEKNNLRAIKALDRLFSYGYLPNVRAKITGAKDASNYRYKIKNLERFDFMGYVDDNELEQLYHDAYALIYPSLNEGFGYPPMEAMRYGVPVLASPYSSIPEVCQGAAIYYNPQSVEEIMNRILFISEEERHNKYSKLSIVQYDEITKKQKSDLDSLIVWLFEKDN